MKRYFEYDTTLAEQVARTSLSATAELNSVTKDAVRQMLLNGRDVYFVKKESGWYYTELKEEMRGGNSAQAQI